MKFYVFVLGILVITITAVVVIQRYKGHANQIITGRVIDCADRVGISGVSVGAWQQQGWGLSNGSLVWDKRITYQTETDGDGRFQFITQLKGNALALIMKDGYEGGDVVDLSPGTNKDISLLKQDLSLPHGRYRAINCQRRSYTP